MVQMNAVYRKSARGTQALARRDPALTLRLRSLLILLDGKRSGGELARLTAGLGDVEQLLTQLDDLGMIEAVAGAAAAQAVPAAPVPTLTLQEAQRAAVRRLTDLMGPAAEDLCLRIESTRTPQDLAAQLRRAEGLVREFKGAAAAAALMQGLRS
jgi:hypothetical protein